MLTAGIALGCYMYQMGQTFNVVTGTVKSVTAKPLSGCRCLRDVFQDPQTAHKYMKYLDKKVQVDSSAPPEPEITPDRGVPRTPGVKNLLSETVKKGD